MRDIRKLILVDYSCHPFSLDLAKKLSEHDISVHYFFSKNINLTGDYYKFYKKKNLKLYGINVGKIPKHDFFRRRFKEISFGNKVLKSIDAINPNRVLLANLPVDPLFKIINFCYKKKIPNFFWVQDIYHLAIKNVLKKNKLFYYTIGYLVYKLYYYLENLCFLKSNCNIFITKKFLNFCSNAKKNYIVENWVPLKKLKYKKIKNSLFQKINKRKFTFTYTGTFSYKHNGIHLISLAKNFKNCNILIISNDKFAKTLFLKARKEGLNNIFLFKLVSYNNLANFFNFTDVGLVNLNTESNDVCVPSKVLTYYKYGIPVLGSMPLKNLASINLKKYKTGLVSKPDDIEAYLRNASELMNNKKLRNICSKNGITYAQKNFNIEEIAKKFSKILELN